MQIEMTWPQYLRGECTVDGAPVQLHRGQMTDLLLLLLMRRGQLVPEVDIIEFLWPNPDDEPDCVVNQIKVVMSRLRSRIGRDVISTEWGRGWSIDR